MKILLPLLLLTTFAHAQDAVQCATRTANYSLAIKMKAALETRVHELAQANTEVKAENYDPYKDPRITLEDVCSGDPINYKGARNQKETSLRLIAKEIMDTGKVSETIAAGIDENSEKNMTPKEFCASLAQTTDDISHITEPNGKCVDVAKEVHRTFVSQDLLSKKEFTDACRVMLPVLKASRFRMKDCEDNRSEVKNDVVVAKEEKREEKKQEPSPKNPPLERKTFKYLSPGGSSSSAQ